MKLSILVFIEKNVSTVNHRNIDLENYIDQNRTSNELKLRAKQLNDDDMKIVAHRGLHADHVCLK